LIYHDVKEINDKTYNRPAYFNVAMLLYEKGYYSPWLYNALLTHKESCEKMPDTDELVFDKLKDMDSEQKFMRNKLSTKNFDSSSLK